MRNKLVILFAAAMFFSPLAASAQTQTTDITSQTSGGNTSITQTTGGTTANGFVLPATQNIFNCNQTGAYAMSTGSLNAVGGTFVPVSDNAVTLNTGYLVYLECVLRPVVDAEVHYATSQYINAELHQYQTGNNGNPQYVRNFNQEYAQAGINAFNSSIQSVVSAMNPAFQSQVSSALQRNFALVSNAPQNALACPYTGDLNSLYQSPQTSFTFAGLFAIANPTCDPVYSYLGGQDLSYAYVAGGRNAWLTQATWGNGTLPITDANGNVLTPGFLVGSVANQATLSGFQQVQNANDIGQMAGPLMAGIGNQILSSGGLAGADAQVGGNPSYLQQVTTEASKGLQQSITNTALSILGPALSIEQQYSQIENAIANILTETIQQLRGAETNCWTSIIANVCTASSTSATYQNGHLTCTASNGAHLTIATSTAFSQPVIDSSITPLSATVVQNVNTASANTATIEALVTTVEMSTDPNAQTNAINQVNALVAAGALQSQADVNAANQNLSDVTSSMQTLVQNTGHTWSGDDTTNNIGGAYTWSGGASQNAWCNTSPSTPGGPATLQAWTTAWTH